MTTFNFFLGHRDGLRLVPTVAIDEQGETMTLNVDVKMGQRANLQVTPTHKGRTVPVDGPVQWSSDDANVVAVTPSADGLACVARPTGVGTVDVVATADAKIGEGVNPQRTTFHFTVREAEASELVGAVVSVEDDA